MKFQTGVATDVGRVRSGNEDGFAVGPRVVAVADGMGGHAGGGTASAIAVAACERLAGLTTIRREDVAAAVTRANDDVVREAQARPDLVGMGTTLSGVAIVELAGVPHFAVFNVGDSRVYRLDGAVLTPLTVDHSEVQELVAAGQLRAEDARSHPARNVITRSLGTQPAPETDVWVLSPGPADRFLVCSDGLTGEVDDPRIAAVLAAEPDPQRAAESLVQIALDAGGRDNVTVVVADAVSTDVLDDPTAPRGAVVGGLG